MLDDFGASQRVLCTAHHRVRHRIVVKLVERIIRLHYVVQIHRTRSDHFLVLLFVKAHLLRRLLAKSRLSLLIQYLLDLGLFRGRTLGIFEELECLFVRPANIIHDDLEGTAPFS